jgi:hypothetical protein
VVEQAVVLVVVEDERGLGPHLGVGGDRVDLAGHEGRALCRREVRVLGLAARRQNPRDRGQLVVAGVELEPLGANAT